MSQDNLLARIHQNSERGHHKRQASRAQGRVTFKWLIKLQELASREKQQKHRLLAPLTKWKEEQDSSSIPQSHSTKEKKTEGKEITLLR